MRINVKSAAEKRLDRDVWAHGARKLIFKLKKGTEDYCIPTDVNIYSLRQSIDRFRIDSRRENIYLDIDDAFEKFTNSITEDSSSTGVFIPSAAIWAQAPTANIPIEVIDKEKKKPWRACVVLSQLINGYEEGVNYRTISYEEFFRWELASFLDKLAFKTNIHFLPIADCRVDYEMELMNVSLRMKNGGAAIVHRVLAVEVAMALIAGSRYCITDNIDIAHAGLASGIFTLYIDHMGLFNRGRLGRPQFSNLHIVQPYSFSARAASEMLLNNPDAVPAKLARKDNKQFADEGLQIVVNGLQAAESQVKIFC